MPALDPRRDFQDDGGTRAWRANQATYGRIIDVGRPARRPVQLPGLLLFILAWGILGPAIWGIGALLVAVYIMPDWPWIAISAWSAVLLLIFVGHFRYFVLGYGRGR